MTPTEVAIAFVDAINSKEVERLADLMTEDHRFIDALCMKSMTELDESSESLKLTRCVLMGGSCSTVAPVQLAAAWLARSFEGFYWMVAACYGLGVAWPVPASPKVMNAWVSSSNDIR